MKSKLSTILHIVLMGTTLLCAEPTTVASDQNTTQQPSSILYPKIKIIFVSQEGCRSCEKVKEHMQYAPIKKLLTEHFIVIHKDISEASSLPKNVEQPIGTPTLYFVDENDQEMIDAMVGGKSEENFTEILEEAIVANQKKNTPR